MSKPKKIKAPTEAKRPKVLWGYAVVDRLGKPGTPVYTDIYARGRCEDHLRKSVADPSARSAGFHTARFLITEYPE